MSSVSSRTVVAVTPEISVCNDRDISAGASPSARARSWSTSSRTDGIRSFQLRGRPLGDQPPKVRLK
jgi:hypothetical protein